MIQKNPDRMAISPSTHSQPCDCPRKPPTMGPIVGPRDGQRAKMAMASPLSEAGNTSAITPPAFVNGDDPKAPAKNRIRRRVWMFCAPAAPALKAVKPP